MFFGWSAQGQLDSISLQRTVRFGIDELPVQLDSSTIYLPSLQISENGSPVNLQYFDFQAGLLDLSASGKNQFKKSAQFVATFLVLGTNLSAPLQRINPQVLQKGDEEEFIAFDFTPSSAEAELIDMQGLNYEGSITRGISFGNAQNLVVNSNFNLRFSGVVSDDIEISAAISDQNIPLQPEGNTQQLQDFDRVFIEIKKGNSKLIAGDFELARPQGYFQNYFKKLKGAYLSHTTEFEKKGTLSAEGGLAISRGKFARNVIIPLEGNQGPYRLSGNDGERFLIVLSGTEKVFIDGELMLRGLENDYTIDYNRAEVTFSQKRLITKDIRIIVEFEYADQNYQRSVFAAQSNYETERGNVFLNIYSEQDSKTAGAAQDLTDEERLALQMAGDNLQLANVPGIDSIETFNEFIIAYKSISTTRNCDGTAIEYLAYTTNADSAQFTASFLNVGQGNGDYVQDFNTAANGRVYIYVPPDSITCERRGSYDPIKQLIAPNLLQMVSLGGNYDLTKKLNVYTETTISKNVLNRFSTVEADMADDVGWANKSGIQFEQILGNKEKDWRLFSEASLEFVQQDFKSLNPYRPAEFNREWNLTSNNTGLTSDTSFNQRSNELIPLFLVGIKQKKKFNFEYSASALLRTTFYQGLRQGINTSFEHKGLFFDGKVSLLNSDGVKENTRYEKPIILIKQRFKKLKNLEVGWLGFREWNQRSLAARDSLELNSFGFNEYKFFVNSDEEENFGFEISYGQRQDFSPKKNTLTAVTLANNLELTGKWLSGKISSLKWNAHLRQLIIQDEELTSLDPKNTLLGRIEHNLNLFKGALSNSLIYEIGSGQEPLVEYRYLQVNPGEGIYFWDPETSDYNNDNVPQIDEIQEAPLPGQGNVIRVSLFTDQFVQTNNNRFNQNLRFEPRRLWNDKKGLLKTLSKCSLQSNLQIDRKTREDPNVQVWNPFQLAIPDTSLVTLNLSTQNTLFYRPLGTKLDMRVGQKERRGRTLLTTGFDIRRSDSWFTRLRWNISKKWSTELEASLDNDFHKAEFLNRQDYDIDRVLLAPSFTFRPSNDLRIITSYRYKLGNNALELGGEKSSQNELEAEVTYNQSTKTSVRLTTTIASVNFDGVANSPVELAMLAGLKDGQNYLWELSLNRNLSESILLTVNYNGRKTGSARVVHLGSVQMGWRF